MARSMLSQDEVCVIVSKCIIVSGEKEWIVHSSSVQVMIGCCLHIYIIISLWTVPFLNRVMFTLIFISLLHVCLKWEEEYYSWERLFGGKSGNPRSGRESSSYPRLHIYLLTELLFLYFNSISFCVQIYIFFLLYIWDYYFHQKIKWNIIILVEKTIII